MVLMLANALITILSVALQRRAFATCVSRKHRTAIRMFGTLGWIFVNLSIDLLGNLRRQPLLRGRSVRW